MDLFDAGKLPYPYGDKSFDIICCYQAIEAYAEPDAWHKIVDEFCRIARRSIVIGFNPPPHKKLEDDQYTASFQGAVEGLRTWKQSGFECQFLEFGVIRAIYQPTTIKLIAVDG